MIEERWKVGRIRGVPIAVQEAAKQLRKEMTPAELRLWQALRGKRLNGLKFRRQHPIGKYVVDFCCLPIRLIIEVDGDIHYATRERDIARDACLQDYGYRVLRIQNAEIIRDLHAVLGLIEAEAGVEPAGLT